MTTGSPTSVAGTPSTTDASLVDRLVDICATQRGPILGVVAALAELLANARGATVRDVGLRLFDDEPPAPLRDAVAAVVNADCGASIDDVGPQVLGQVYERLLDADERSRRGTHLTARTLAARLVGCLEPAWTGAPLSNATGDPPRVLDPAVGGGAFLLAAADALVDAGWSPDDAWRSQQGIDIDAGAVAVAEAALALWCLEHGLAARAHDGLKVGDGLLDPLPSAAVVVGNPPFLTQLRRGSASSADRRERLRARWGDLVGAYTDEAWLFMAAAIEALEDRGQVTLVQPVSVLAARHGAAVRRWVHERADLTGLWVADGRVFDASVEVCAPVLRRRDPNDRAPLVRRWSGPEVTPSEPARPATADSWGRAAAPLVGTPAVVLDRSVGTLADRASTTAGFRDQFYGFAPHVREDDGHDENDERPDARLVTVGMIDPARLRWGRDTFRFAGRRWHRPVVDRGALAHTDPSLAAWADERRRPKVLVATQTRIIEAWADLAGNTIPATPVISVEPVDPHAAPAELFRLLAAISAPPIAADRAAAAFGTAMSVRALKLAARDLLDVPLPVDGGAWQEAADRIAAIHDADERPASVALLELGEVLARAHGVADHDLVAWWCARWPTR